MLVSDAMILADLRLDAANMIQSIIDDAHELSSSPHGSLRRKLRDASSKSWDLQWRMTCAYDVARESLTEDTSLEVRDFVLLISHYAKALKKASYFADEVLDLEAKDLAGRPGFQLLFQFLKELEKSSIPVAEPDMERFGLVAPQFPD